MSYQPKPETEEKAISFLRGKSKVMPVEMAGAISVNKMTARNLCIYLHAKGQLIRDGRSYTWNPIGAAVGGPMDGVYLNRSYGMLDLVDGHIKDGGSYNRGLANAYRNGMVNTCIGRRRWTDTLKKIRTKLLNCIEVQNPILLLDVERELSLDVPGWAGDLYKRSRYAQEMLTAERKMAAAKKKKRPVDEAFHEERRAKLEANIALTKEAKLEAARQQAAALHEIARQILDTYIPEDAAALVARFAKGMTPAGIQSIVASTPPEPVQPESCPLPPIVPDYVDTYEEFHQDQEVIA